MKETPTLSSRIKGLKKPGDSFILKTAAERDRVYATVQMLLEEKLISENLTIKTMPCASGFKIYAI